MTASRQRWPPDRCTRRFGAVRAAGRTGRVGGVIEAEGLTSDGYIPVKPGLRGAVDRAAASRHIAANGRVEVTATPAVKLTARSRVRRERERRHHVHDRGSAHHQLLRRHGGRSKGSRAGCS